MKAKLEIRPATPADYPGIGRLLDRRLGPIDYSRRLTLWEWRATRNPARVGDFPAFLVASRGDEILGAHGLIPTRVTSFGESGHAAFACDFAVDESARNVGLRLKVSAMAAELCDVAISTSANATARDVTVALGGLVIPGSGQSFICPLRPERFVRGRLKETAARAAGLAFRAVTSGRAMLSGSTSHARAIGRFDPSIDAIWKKSTGVRSSLAVLRDSSYLNWRYFDYPHAETLAFAVGPEMDARALAVGQAARDHAGLNALLLGELLFREGDSWAARRALDAVLAEALRRRTDYVYGRFSDPEVVKLLASRGFLRRGGAGPGDFTVKPNRLARAAEVEAAYFTAGDGDCALL